MINSLLAAGCVAKCADFARTKKRSSTTRKPAPWEILLRNAERSFLAVSPVPARGTNGSSPRPLSRHAQSPYCRMLRQGSECIAELCAFVRYLDRDPYGDYSARRCGKPGTNR